jgi:hypothetical protein
MRPVKNLAHRLVVAHWVFPIESRSACNYVILAKSGIATVPESISLWRHRRLYSSNSNYWLWFGFGLRESFRHLLRSWQGLYSATVV